MKTINKKLLQAGMLGAVVGMANFGYASSFKLLEADAGDVGNRYSGVAVKKDDATTNFFNAAGLATISGTQISVGATAIYAQAKMKGTVSPGGAFDKDGGKSAIIPNIHLAIPLNDQWTFGFGITVPFGLSTDYGTDNNARRAATKSEIETIDYNANLAYRFNDQWSVGAGVSVQYLKATLNSFITSTTELKNTADGYGLGFNLGVLYQYSDDTRFGLSYRSAVNHSVNGKSETSTGAFATNNNLTADVKLPDVVMFSAYHDFTDRISAMATVEWTRWSTVDILVLKNTAVGTVTTPFHYKNTWRLALGGNYILNEKWTLTGGVDFDQTPTNNTDRDIRLPDANRLGVGAGFKYTHNQALSVDVGASWLFFQESNIHTTSSGVDTNASGRPKVGLLGVQLNWKL